MNNSNNNNTLLHNDQNDFLLISDRTLQDHKVCISVSLEVTKSKWKYL